jgi:hypothetical protein
MWPAARSRIAHGRRDSTSVTLPLWNDIDNGDLRACMHRYIQYVQLAHTQRLTCWRRSLGWPDTALSDALWFCSAACKVFWALCIAGRSPHRDKSTVEACS